MFNYFKAEWYRTLHKRSFWLFSGAMMLGAILFPLLVLSVNGSADLTEMLEGSMSLVLFLPYFCVLVSCFFVAERGGHTLKNSTAMGLGREKTYLVKFAASLLLCTALFVLFLGVLVLMSLAVFGLQSAALAAFLPRAAIALVLALALCACAVALGMVFSKSFITLIVFVCLFTMVFSLLNNLSFEYQFLDGLLRWCSFTRLAAELQAFNTVITGEMLRRCFSIFGLYFAAASAGGFLLFRRMEIK